MSDGVMLSSLTHIETDKASRYLQQMCKHFAHKLTVDFDPATGRVDFPFGVLSMEAGSDQLTLAVTAGEADSLARMKDVTERHLVRFMFRENPEFTWQDGSGEDA